MYKNRTHIYNKLAQKKGQIAILIDPEKATDKVALLALIQKAEFAQIDFFFIGGSTVTRKETENIVSILKANTDIPLILFPGSSHQISHDADAILLLSLLSGRNADFLIGHHVLASPELHQSSLEILPTAYILIEGGTKSSVAYISQTTPIPSDQDQIALQTALAGAMQGKRIIYYDAGSGAKNTVPLHLIEQTHKALPNCPIIVGGGIRSIQEIENFQNDANVIVIGNHIEQNADFLLDIANRNKTNDVTH
ncbi:MAG TPA: geranylgeranylglyceryl/heptaprenylglyceryl phosphate synthase [Crocinitomicaceae bacterium]|nr:geranylgeranylglyceryl/heptaprenylglyceryl phosphate synthase [Crocinitomicaceae bacterium]